VRRLGHEHVEYREVLAEEMFCIGLTINIYT
jgi:hypothetical protein